MLLHKRKEISNFFFFNLFLSFFFFLLFTVGRLCLPIATAVSLCIRVLLGTYYLLFRISVSVSSLNYNFLTMALLIIIYFIIIFFSRISWLIFWMLCCHVGLGTSYVIGIKIYHNLCLLSIQSDNHLLWNYLL